MEYDEIVLGLKEITEVINAERKRLRGAKNNVSSAAGVLGTMATTYSGLVAALDNLSTANPEDTDLIAKVAEKDRLISVYQALKTIADSMKVDVDQYSP